MRSEKAAARAASQHTVCRPSLGTPVPLGSEDYFPPRTRTPFWPLLRVAARFPIIQLPLNEEVQVAPLFRQGTGTQKDSKQIMICQCERRQLFS
jgi:hypothetical protein